MRALLLAILMLIMAGPVLGVPPELPVYYPGAGLIAPAWLGDRFEIRLAPTAAARARHLSQTLARAAFGARATPIARLDVPALDRLAAFLGARFEPVFADEHPPADTSRPDLTSYWVVHLPRSVALESALSSFRSLPEVSAAEPIAIVPFDAVPDDSLWAAAWWADQPSGHDVDALEAWQVTSGDSSVVIAILDTGVIPYHPDLAGNLFVNAIERDGIPGVDDDGNGVVDDIRGWDFVDLPTNDEVRAGEDWRDQDGDPNDFAGHGTAVAGLAGATTFNRIGVVSAAWSARILPVRIGWSAIGLPLGVVDMLTAARGIRYATRTGALVVNCSFASSFNSALADAVTEAIAGGVTIVASAGNNHSVQYLGRRDDVLSVAATDSEDRIPFFSNRGDYVDLAAPGVNLPTTTLRRTSTDSLGQRQPGYTTSANGTSFSAPIAAGAVALIQSSRRENGLPPLDPLEVILRLRETATNIDDLNAGTSGYGTGRLHLFRALTDRPTSRVVRLGAATVGPAVWIPHRDGPSRLAVLTDASELVLVDAIHRTILRSVTLPGNPATQLAAADLGGGRGVGLFIGTTNGFLAGYYANGDPRPGWPQSPGIGPLVAGPALGDLDGDGTVEIVCGSRGGTIWAWRSDGSTVPGFPLRDPVGPLAGPIALGDLDGAPGLEIVAMSTEGIGHAWRGDGTTLAGWPFDTGSKPFPLAPVIGRFAHAGPPLAVFSTGDRAIAVDQLGEVALSIGFAGLVITPSAIGDIDGDGADELITAVVAPGLPAQLCINDSTGRSADPQRWPLRLSDVPTGEPIVAPLAAGGATGILLPRTQGLFAVSVADAESLGNFPKPGEATTHLSCGDIDGDGAIDIAAGAGRDGRLFIYDSGPGVAKSLAAWPTGRANYARTGSPHGAPSLAEVDDVPPAQITDLRAHSATDRSVRLAWTTVGADGSAGLPERYVLTATPVAKLPGNAALAAYVTQVPDPNESFEIEMGELALGTRYRFEVAAVDVSGNRSASNVVESLTLPGPAGSSAFAIRPNLQPSGRPVVWLWNGVAGRPHRIRIHDLAGRRVRTLEVGTSGAGEAQWDGRGERGERLGAGIYFAELACDGLRARARVVLAE